MDYQSSVCVESKGEAEAAPPHAIGSRGAVAARARIDRLLERRGPPADSPPSEPVGGGPEAAESAML